MKKYTKLMCALVTMFVTYAIMAVEVTPEQAQTAVRNWIRKNPRPMTAQFTTGSGEAKTFKKDNKTLFHVVQLEGGGFVVTSGDTRISPIVAFSESGEFSHDVHNPLLDFLMCDMDFRQTELSAHDSASASPRLMTTSATASQLSSSSQQKTANESAWEELLDKSTTRPRLSSVAAQSQLSDVRVAPLLKTEWDQSTWGNYSNTSNTFNYHTPQHMVCGCVATAGAQIMKRWEYPKAAIAASEFDCTVNGKPARLKMKGDTYSWSLMTEVFSTQNWNLPEINREAIGRLTYDVGVASHMNYTDTKNGSGTQTDMMVEALKTVFKYKMSYVKDCQIYKGTSLTDEIKAAIYGSLDAGMPVSASIRRPNGNASGGHSVVFDGYGYVGNTLYTHINCGWAQGGDNIWYDVMGEGLTTSCRFYLLNLIGYNIHPTRTGDVISGRVLSTDGMAVSGATVSISKQGHVVDTTTTNERGMWFFFVSDLGTYGISAIKGNLKSKQVSVEHQKASQTATYTALQTGEYKNTNAGFCGNKWGNDLILESEGDIIPEEPSIKKVSAPVFSPTVGSFTSSSLSVTLSCDTSGATIYYTKNGTTPTTSSTKYTGAIAITSTTTFKAIAVKSGMANSDVVAKTYTKNKPAISVGNALDDTSRVYTVSSSSDAYGQDEVTHDGTDALRLSCAKTSGAKTSVTASFSGAGTLSFWWCDPSATPLYSSDASTIIGYNNYYYCKVTKSDGTEYGSWKCSGISWEKCEIPLMAGTYTVEWSVSAGAWIYAADRTSYLDEVAFVAYSGGSRKVTFSANGGSGVPEKVSITGAFGSLVTVSGQGTLDRDGYKFVGWSTSTDAVKAEYDIGESVQLGASDIVLYAVWKKWIPVLVEIPQGGGESVQPLSLYGNSFVAYISFPSWADKFKMTGKTSSGGTTTLNLGNGRSRLSISGDLSLTFSAAANDTAEDRAFDLDMDAINYPYVIRYQIVQKADVVSEKPKGLVVDGACSVVSSSAASFSAQVVRRNGVVNEVSPTWSVASGGSYATVSSSGKLTAKSVTSPKTVVLRASYTDNGVKCTADQEVSILPTCNLSTALDNNSLTFQTGSGANAWFGQYDVSNDGVDSARASSALGGTPWIKTVVQGPALVSFDCLMSSDGGNALYFVDNGKTNECAFSVPMTISAWQRKQYSLVEAGSHEVMIVYKHDGGATGRDGGDAAWVDNFVVGELPKICTVTFNANGGTVSPTTRDVNSGSVVGTLPTATRTGYALKGWYTSSSGGTQIKSSTKVEGNVMYYAQWTANTYTVTFNANGGTGSMANMSMTYGVAKNLSNNAFTKSGSVFVGWATSAGGNVVYANRASVKNLTATQGATVTLYAKWMAVTAGSYPGAAVAFPMTPSVAAYPVALARKWLEDDLRYDDARGVMYCKSSVSRGKVYTVALPASQAFDVTCPDEAAVVEYATSGSLRFCRIDARGITSPTADLLLVLTGTPGDRATVYVVEGDYVPAGAVFDDPPSGGFPGSCPGKAVGLPFGASAQAKSVSLVSEWDEANNRYLGGGVYYLRAAAARSGRLTVAVPAAQADAFHVTLKGVVVSSREDYSGIKFAIFDAKAGDTVLVRLSGTRGSDAAVYTYGGDFLAKKLIFDPNGGTCLVASKDVRAGAPVGKLPDAKLGGSAFAGWYTAREGGARVTADTVMVGFDVPLYAHWEPVAAGSCREKAIPFPFGPSVAAYPVTLAKEWLAGEERYNESSGVLYCKSSVSRGKVYTLALPAGQKFTVSCEDAGAIVEYATSGTLRLCLVDARDLSEETAELDLALSGGAGSGTTVYAVEGNLVPAGADYEDPDPGDLPGSCPGKATGLEFADGARVRTVRLVREWDEGGRRLLDGSVRYLRATAPFAGRLTVAVSASQAEGCTVTCARAAVSHEDFSGLAFWVFDAQAGDEVLVALSGARGADATVYTVGWDYLAKKLVFDANGGECPVEFKDVHIGQPVGELPVPVRGARYVFRGWSVLRDSDAFVSPATVMVAYDVTLYARWEELAWGSFQGAAVPFSVTSALAAFPVSLAREWIEDERRYSDERGALYCKTTLKKGKVYTMAVPHGLKKVDAWCVNGQASTAFGSDASLQYVRFDTTKMTADETEVYFAAFGDLGQRTTVYAVEGDFMPKE